MASTPSSHGGTRPGGNPNLRERFNAMRNLPPFLKQIWQTSPGLTMASLGLRLIRALLPIITLYIGKLIIDEAIGLVEVQGDLRAGDRLIVRGGERVQPGQTVTIQDFAEATALR